MDNQFYPQGGGYPQGQPAPGQQPAPGYGTQAQPPVNPYGAYGVQPEAAYPQQGTYDPYDLQQAGYAAYTQGQQPVQPGQQPYQVESNPYQAGHQPPYGGVQQPMRKPDISITLITIRLLYRSSLRASLCSSSSLRSRNCS